MGIVHDSTQSGFDEIDAACPSQAGQTQGVGECGEGATATGSGTVPRGRLAKTQGSGVAVGQWAEHCFGGGGGGAAGGCSMGPGYSGAAPKPVTRGTPYGLDTGSREPSVLEIAQHIAGASRSRDYGHPYENHARIAAMWNTQLGPKLKDGCAIEPREVALMMIALKLAREVNTPKFDNSVDMAGYVQCLDLIDQFTAATQAKP